MIAVIQRVSSSCVRVDEKIVGQIGQGGLNILLGVKKGDSKEDIKKLVNKIVNLRIFQDENQKMNLSLLDVKGEALIISQFTLAGNVKKKDDVLVLILVKNQLLQKLCMKSL